MARFAYGRNGRRSATKKEGGTRFTPTIRWSKDGETKYIQFLTSIEEILTVYYHPFITVGYKDDGRPIYRNFVSPKSSTDADGNLVLDHSAVDPIWDRFELPARKRTFAVAVEMEPIMESVTDSRGRPSSKVAGFQTAMRKYENKDGEEQEVPAVGLIEQSPSIFFGWLDTFANARPIEDVVLSVTRRGKGTDTRYDFYPAGDALAKEELGIPDELMFNLDAHLESQWMTDEDIAMLQSLPDGHVLNKFAERGKGGDKRAQARPVVHESAAADPDTSSSDDAATSSSNRFEQLRRNMAARN